MSPIGLSLTSKSPQTVKMGFVEDELKQLKSVISSLDARVKQLEHRATGTAGPVTTDEIRMILIGPPGAGNCRPTSTSASNPPY